MEEAALAVAPPRWALSAFARLRSLWQRWFLWLILAVLVSALLVTVVWLAGRHEVEQVQANLDRDTADAVSDLRIGLQRNAQSLRATQASGLDRTHWPEAAAALLREHREWLRLEWRDAALRPLEAVNTPYRMRLIADESRGADQSDVGLACAAARKLGAPAYSPSHYVPILGGGGVEVMELCVPIDAGGFLVASYSLRDTLIELVGPTLTRGQEVAFTEADGTRLVALGTSRRTGTRVFTSQQLIDLPGAALMLRVDGWRAAPDLFPNVLTALVTAISIALVSVLVLLARDTRRRLRAERDLADALAFRKAMEDSVITGLRARDLQGRITYVNPAFCEMVGFSPEELMAGSGEAIEAPYWPTELAHEYQQRQARRLAGGMPPREGFESVFMRKDGTRFPVLIFEAPLINAQRVQTGWMSAFIDISEQRRIEELSRASQERLQASARLATVGEMASLLSHELTQPLAAIASYATGSLNMLGPHAKGEQAEVAMAVRRIAEQADRAGQVIRSVHDFVRRRDRTREAVAPQALIDAVLPLVRLQARKLGVSIEVVFEDRLPAAVCDRTLVEQVLLNLARNAMQAMDTPEHVGERVLRLRVSRVVAVGGPAGTEDARRWLEFAVADLGCGISEEVAGRLFTPFFTTRADGMGLGLSLCRTVVEQHGGVLVFEPNRPRGTVFRFTLPST
ncbi:two-component system sensor histidine kinase NtrB [Variovorax paradoxus]|jgi:two-component system sensor histidine kinase DctS|uniref:two-component system sensor histidine kinase NtrB n=1 Tax=Variovorax paradoxus TaxID=34073 RepID=UPI0029C710CA|nr:ATP-binding protein [Variovorax paradoxus]WPH20415.1 PAS domain S-box protein [Variovorax paradoxus]